MIDSRTGSHTSSLQRPGPLGKPRVKNLWRFSNSKAAVPWESVPSCLFAGRVRVGREIGRCISWGRSCETPQPEPSSQGSACSSFGRVSRRQLRPHLLRLPRPHQEEGDSYYMPHATTCYYDASRPRPDPGRPMPASTNVPGSGVVALDRSSARRSCRKPPPPGVGINTAGYHPGHAVGTVAGRAVRDTAADEAEERTATHAPGTPPPAFDESPGS